MSCIEWLGVALIKVGRRQVPSALHYGEENHLRLDVPDYARMAAAALNQIRQYGCGSTGVVTRLLDMIARVAEELANAEDRAVLLEHAQAIRDDGLAAARNRDRRDIGHNFEIAQRALTKI